MTIGIAVDGTEIAAYACNGTDDEAWFFGNQNDGKIDITSRFRDTLKAEFDGKDVVGDLTMNGVAYKFTAAPVSGAAQACTPPTSTACAHRGWCVPTAARPACSSTAASAAATSSRPSCSSSTRRSSATGAQQAAASAGPADHTAGEPLGSSTHQRPRCDAHSRQRHASGCDITAFVTQRPCRRDVQRHTGGAVGLCLTQNQTLQRTCGRCVASTHRDYPAELAAPLAPASAAANRRWANASGR